MIYKPRIKPAIYRGKEINYAISDNGIVFDEDLNIVSSYKMPTTGYWCVKLKIDNDEVLTTVHRLVAETYIPNPDNLPTVNHHNGDKDNNYWYNLEWMSYSDNNIHALEAGLRQPLSCENHQNATLTNQQVIKICEMLQNGETYETIIDVLNLSNIENIKRKLIMIKTGNSWLDISSNFKISKERRSSKNIYSTEIIHNICSRLQSGERDYGKILKYVGLDDNRATRKLVSTIFTRKKHKSISCEYKWDNN